MAWVLAALALGLAVLVGRVVLAWLWFRRCPACGGFQRVVGEGSVLVEGWLLAYRWPVKQCRRCGRTEYPPESVRLGERPGRGKLSDP
jgi:hypothetical protein